MGKSIIRKTESREFYFFGPRCTPGASPSGKRWGILVPPFVGKFSGKSGTAHSAPKQNQNFKTANSRRMLQYFLKTIDGLVCVDGAWNQLMAIGGPREINSFLNAERPLIWVGDGDSLTTHSRKNLKANHSVQVVSLPKEKDTTDLGVALNVLEQVSGLSELVVWGGMGGRMDHQLVVLEELKNFHRHMVKRTSENAMLFWKSGIGGDRAVFLNFPRSMKSIECVGIKGSTFSLFGDAYLSEVQGAKYKRIDLKPAISARTLSNIALKNCLKIRGKAGQCVMFISAEP